jgi:hypothetical protein
MTRFGRQHRDLQRRAARQQVEIVDQAFFVRPGAGCVESRQEVELDDSEFRISQRLVVYEEKLVEYALVLCRFQGGEWAEVYSIDTRHGVLHEHISGHRRKDDRRDLYALYTQVDVQESLDDPAMYMVLEKYRRMRS